MTAFEQQFKRYAAQSESALAMDLEIPPLPEAILYEAMSYSLAAGGKRFRPVLLHAVGEMLAIPVEQLNPYARALEMIHTYSLIHDDLPAMDDDDLRRGRPTNHKVFGEAMAILAGDALLNRAYEIMLDAVASASDAGRAVEAARVVAQAAGASGMVGGQVLDMLGETSPARDTAGNTETALLQLRRIHSLKTGELIRAAVAVPVALCGLLAAERKALNTYAEQLGISFQIRDDLLDAQGTEAELGKPIGSDARNGKHTYVSILGIDDAQQALREATSRALDALTPFGEKAEFLAHLARFVASRTY